ncbi:hypothetical protein IKG13_01495 [Candidatus Saccharibacteria bacterium]|nr:hypothetical protein [Candidatus Saccharibacteria bacterium]
MERPFYKADSMRVATAINNTRLLDPAYLEATLKKHIAGGAGSVFNDISSVEQMEQSLKAANWKQAEHAGVPKGMVAFVTTDIPGGLFGMVRIEDLSDETVLTAIAPKRSNRVSLTVSDVQRKTVAQTWVILAVDPESGEEFMMTFHPGEPIDPGLVMGDKLVEGQVITKARALKLGYEWANIV